MNKPLGASKTLELLEDLKANVRDFTARAEKLSGDLKAKLARERQRRQATAQELTARFASETVAADSEWQAAVQSGNQNYEARKAWINKAYRTSKEQALARIENLTGRKKYELQKQVLQAERAREESLASTTAAFEEFKRNLGAEGETLSLLEATGRRAFKGHRKFIHRLEREYARAKPDDSRDAQTLLAELRGLLDGTKGHLDHIQRIFLLRLFRHVSIWILLFLCLFALVPLREKLGLEWLSWRLAAIAAGAGLAVVLVLRFIVELGTSPLAASISSALAKARTMCDSCVAISDSHHQQDLERIHREFESATQQADHELKQAHAEAAKKRMASRGSVDEKTIRIAEKHEQFHKQRSARIEALHTETLARLQQESTARESELMQSSEELEKKLEATFQLHWQELDREWRSRMLPIYEGISFAQTAATELFPSWDSPAWSRWTAPSQFARAAQLAQFKVDVQKLGETGSKGPPLALPGPSSFSLPLCLTYPEEGSVLIETAATGRDLAIGALNNLILRLLSVAPPGRLNFSIIDPVGLGQNFAGVMHLADYEEQLINSRIWTQSSQIEQRLATLNEHIEKVIQMYLRNEYRTIAEYNEQAGVIAEKYHFLVVADFPVNFSDTAARRLLSIAGSGARCGVYMLIHWDTRQPLPQDFVPDELRKNSVCISCKGTEFIVAGKPSPGADLAMLAPPSPYSLASTL